MTVSLVMTDQISTFVESLQDGDVILFDSVKPLSDLIKFAENRPVNHCALYLGDGSFAHVGWHTPGQQPGDLPLEAAVKVDSLQRWLGSRRDRTVTGFRHVKALDDPSAGEAVCAAAHGYINPKDTTYDYLSLIALMVPSLLRSYESYFDDRGRRTLQAIAGPLRRVANSLVKLYEDDAARPRNAVGQSLTCSEFIYRSFDNALGEFRLEVLKPIARVDKPTRLRSPEPEGSGRRGRSPGPGSQSAQGSDGGPPVVTTRRSATPRATRGRSPFASGGSAAGHEFVDGAGLVMFDKSFRADFLGPAEPVLDPAAPVPDGGTRRVMRQNTQGTRRGLPAGTGKDLAIIAGQVIINLIWDNRLRGKYDDGTLRSRQVFPDLVTPRDLWSSPSLTAVSVLHRPPRPEDAALDTVQPAVMLVE